MGVISCVTQTINFFALRTTLSVVNPSILHASYFTHITLCTLEKKCKESGRSAFRTSCEQPSGVGGVLKTFNLCYDISCNLKSITLSTDELFYQFLRSLMAPSWNFAPSRPDSYAGGGKKTVLLTLTIFFYKTCVLSVHIPLIDLRYRPIPEAPGTSSIT